MEMNVTKLQEVIEQYRAALPVRWNDEKYKWEVVKYFRENWNEEEEDFSAMLEDSMKKAESLLSTTTKKPLQMMTEYAKQAPEGVRGMFQDLYDESQDVMERIVNFQARADILCERYSPGRQHHQSPMAISIYLWLKYPGKHYIYNYSLLRKAARVLESDFVPKKGDIVYNIKGNTALLNMMKEVLMQQEQLVSIFSKYPHDNYQTLVFDLMVYTGTAYQEFLEEEEARKKASQKDVIKMPSAEKEPYSKADFLSEVYLPGEKYEILRGLLLQKQNIILQGTPGVGKTFAAKRLAYSLIGAKEDSQVEFIQFHQSYAYEDFIMGYKPSEGSFSLRKGIFLQFCEKAVMNPNKSYFFIIDEINRGNMSKIFGELLALIEKDYREMPIMLANNDRLFAVPKNIYIIGMMNTADRSLAMIDYALRRRFSFFEVEPGFTSEGFKKYQAELDDETFDLLIEKIVELNSEITKDNFMGAGFSIGHSYFCNQTKCTDEWMQAVVEYDILPMLAEYWLDEPERLQKWQNILRGVFND